MAADILYQSLDLMMMSILASSDLADGKRLDPKAREKLINGAGRLSTALETFGIRRKAK